MTPWPILILGAAVLVFAVMGYERAPGPDAKQPLWLKILAPVVVLGMLGAVVQMGTESKVAGIGGVLILIALAVAETRLRRG